MLISASADLLVLFLGLELMVLPGYLLAGFAKRDALSTEGAIKYFLLGSFSSAIFLFGLAFVWGLTGTTRIDGVATALTAMSPAARSVQPRPGDGPGLPDHRRRLQDRRGPVPLLDAGRLPGLTDAGHRLPVGRAQGRRLRPDPAPVRGRARADQRRLEHRDRPPGRGHDDPGQPRRPDPGQRQADAGLLVDRPHRLHADRAGRLVEPELADRGPRGPALLRRGLRGDEPGRLRRDRRAPAPDRASRASSSRSPGWAAGSRSWRS